MASWQAPPTKLPPLPFCNDQADLTTDVARFAEKLSSVCTSLNECSAIGNPAEFFTKSVVLQINGMTLVATANSAGILDVGSGKDTTLMIPFSGRNISRVGTTNFEWQAHQCAMFISSVGRRGTSGTRSSLLVDIDRQRWQDTARAMLGGTAATPIDFQLNDACTLPLRTPWNDFDGIFRQLARMIDNVHGDTVLLGHLGVDEMFYRAMVLLFRPDLFAAPPAGRSHPRRELDSLCDHIRANLGERITLSDLERIAGLSARSLQYAFRERFGCTPMQWVREERLLKARHYLQNLRDGESIADIAVSLCFMNQGGFSSYYRRRFGELPSDTVARK